MRIASLVLLFCLVSCRSKEVPPQESAAYVDCKSAGATLSSGLVCSIEHRQGTKPVHACWTVNIACANGTAGHASACGDVAPQAKSSTMVPFTSFNHGLDNCDQVLTFTISNMKLEER